MRNQQAGTADYLCQYRTSNTDHRPQHSAYSTFGNGAYSGRQTSNWQTSSVLHEAASIQQPTGRGAINYYSRGLHGNLQNSCMNTQNGNPYLKDFHLNSGFSNSSTQSSPEVMKANTAYPQQDISAHWNQASNAVPYHHRHRIPTGVLQNLNEEMTKPVSAYTTTATSLPHEQLVCTSTLVPATGQNRHTAYNRQNDTQHRFYPSTSPPNHMTVSQSSRNNSSNSLSSKQIFRTSSMHQKTQQYPVHLNSTQNNREVPTSSLLSKVNELPLNPAADSQEQMFRRQRVARIEDYLRKSDTDTSDGTYRGKQSVSKVRMTKAITESYKSDASQSLTLDSRPSLPKTTHSAMSKTQHSVNAPQQNSIPDVIFVTATGDGSGNLPGLSNASQLRIPPESLSPPRSKTNSSVANSPEMIRISDNQIHLSPGHTGTRAVAVVQPLSQENHQLASKHASSNMINQSAEPTKTDENETLFISAVAKNKTSPHLREGSNLYPQKPSQRRSSKSLISHSKASNDSVFVSSSGSAVHQESSQKQLYADDTASEIAINVQVDQQHVVLNGQQSKTSEVPVSQLFSVPTKPWTIAELTDLIVIAENVQMKSINPTAFDSASKLLHMFWNGSNNNLVCKLRTGWYKDLITDVAQFLSKHVALDSVALSQAQYDFEKQPKRYHVLKDNEVYSEELPYKSSWLNVNEQLDDIDKEFGFSLSLKHCLQMPESHSQPDQVGTVNSTPAQIVSEGPNKVSSQTELEPVGSGEEQQSFTVETTSTQTASPNETESGNSIDPYYSFHIEVLPPEEAKVFFERAQSMDTDSQEERAVNSSVDSETPKDTDVASNNSEEENKSVCPIEEVCCLPMWLETICGSDTLSLSKCECKNKQSLRDCTDKTLDKEEVVAQGEGNLCGSDGKFHMEGDNQTKGEENIDNQIRTHSRSELCNDQIIDLTENVHKFHSSSDKEPENQRTKKSWHTHHRKLKKNKLTETRMTAAIQTTLSLSKHITVQKKQKRPSTLDGIFPVSKKSKKYKPPVDVDSQPSNCKKGLINVTDSEPLASKGRVAKLALFGSEPQDKSNLTGSRRRLFSSVSHGVPRPPEVISLALSPLKRKPSETVQTGRHLVKHIHEKFNFSPTRIAHRSKLKTQRHTSPSLSVRRLKKAVSSEMRIWNLNNKGCPSHKRKRSLSDGLRRGRKKKTDVVSVKQPADHERRIVENGSHAVSVLRFNVLPSTFNFKDGQRKETNDPVPNKPAIVKGKDKNPNKAIMRAKGTWYQNPEKEHGPLRSASTPKVSNLFLEFQKKYRRITQPSMDE